MTSLQPFSLPPRWLPLHLLLGGMLAAGVVVLFPQQHPSPAPLSWARCTSSLIVLAMGLLLALCIGLVVGLHARQLGSRAERFIDLLGRALACLPAVVLVWGFMSGWIGRLGLPVESLMPAQLPVIHHSLQSLLARTLWDFLAPALILALPLSGDMIHSVIVDGRAVADLDLSLRARGVPRGSRLWLHRLGQLLPLLRVRMQSLCLIAPVYLIIIEDALRFTGWGGWLAQNIRAGAAGGIALGFASGGVMLALLCAALHVRGRLHLHGLYENFRQFLDSKKRRTELPSDASAAEAEGDSIPWFESCLRMFRISTRPVQFALDCVTALAWQPWLLWALGAQALFSSPSLLWIILWLALFVSGSAAWLQAWKQVEAKLPVDASRVFGPSPGMIWRQHFARLQFRMLAAWICTALAHTLLGIAAACALQPALLEKLYAPLARMYRPLAVASAQDAVHALADPTALLQSGGGIALAALCLLQISRIVQPRNP